MQGGEGSGTRTTARAQSDLGSESELHDDDELAAVIAAQIQSYTSTKPLPVVDPLRDPRLRPIPLDDVDDSDGPDPSGEPQTVSARHAAPADDVPLPKPVTSRADPRPADDRPPAQPQPASASASVPAPSASVADDDDARLGSDPSEITQAIPIAAAADRVRFVPGPRRSVRAEQQQPSEPPPTEPISVQLRAELPPLEPSDLPGPLVDAGPLTVPPSLYEEWERTLRRIGQPADGDVLVAEVDAAPAIADSTSASRSEFDATADAEPRGEGPHGAGPLEAGPLGPEPVPPQVDVAESGPGAVVPAAVLAAPRDAAVRALTRPDVLAVPVAPASATPASATPASATLAPVAPAPATAAPVEGRGVLEPDVAPPSADPSPLPPATDPRGAVDAAPDRSAPVPDDRDGAFVEADAAVAVVSAAEADRIASRPGLLAGLLGWATVLVSAPILLLAVLLGDPAVGRPATAAVGIAVGAVLALPGSLRLANRARTAGGVVQALRGLLGPPVGTAAAVLLVIARILAVGLLLLVTDELAAAFVTRTGALPSLSGGVTAVLAVLAVATFGVIGALFRSRAATIVLGIVGFLGVVITLLLVALLTSVGGIRAGGSPQVGPVAAVAAAGFAVVVLLQGGGPGAALGRIASPGSRWTALVGGAIGVLVAAAAWVTVVQVASGDGVGAVPSDTLVGGIVDATAAQVAVPAGVAALVAVAAGAAVLARTGGDLLAGVVRVPGSRGPAGAAVALASVAVALGLVSVGADAGDVVGRYGPIVLVPLAALAGFAATAPRFAARPAGVLAGGIGLLTATVIGLLFVDGLVVRGERGPLLAAVGLTDVSLAAGLGAALILGALTGVVALLVGRSRPATPAEREPADTVA